MHVPIISVPGRGQTIDTNYVYDTQQWTALWVPNPTQQYPHGGFYNIILNQTDLSENNTSNWRLTNPFDWQLLYTASTASCVEATQNGPVTYGYNVITGFTAIDPEGTSHSISLRLITPSVPCNNASSTESGPASDGSGIWVTAQGDGGTLLSARTITLKDGTRADISEDTNGNLFGGFSGSPVQIANAGSVTYTSPLGKTQVGAASTTWTVQDSNGNEQAYLLNYTLVDYSTNFCSAFRQYPGQTCVDHLGAELEPSTLTLPTGQKYEFNWVNNSALELQSVGLPSGGSIAYTYTPLAQTQFPIAQNPQSNPVHMAVTSRTVNHDGSSALWTYNPTAGGNTIVDPLGNSEIHSFSFLTTSQGLLSTYRVESQVQYLSGNGTGATPLRTENMTYAFDVDPASSKPVNPRVIQRTATLNDSVATSKPVNQVQTDFESFTYNYHSVDTGGSGEVQVTGGRSNPTEHREYDWGSGSAGALLRRTDYTYLHNVNSVYLNLNIVDRATSIITYAGSGTTPAAQTSNEYDVYNHTGLPAMQASGAVEHDSARSTSYTTRGNRTAVSKWRNSDGAWLTTESQYDDAGNGIATLDPLGNETTFSYTDSWSNAACAPSGEAKAYLTTITNALAQITTKKYNSCTGTLASTTDPNLQSTSNTYDLMGRVTQVSYPDGGSTTSCYTDVGGSTCNQSGPPYQLVTTKAITSSSNETATVVYDGLGRVSQTQLNSDSPSTTYTLTTYDLLGRTSQVYNPTRCNPITTNCGETTWGITTYNYDPLDRTISVVDPDGSTAGTAYDQTNASSTGVCTTATDEAGKSRQSCVDGVGRMTGVWEDPGSSPHLNYETDYVYDVLNDLTTVTQKGGSASNWRTRTFTYNSLSQLLSASNPESGSISYTYDADGNLSTKTAPSPNQSSTGTAKVITTYTYDALNRITGKSYNDAYNGNSTPGVTYGYDGVNLSCPTPMGYSGTSATNGIGRRTATCFDAGSKSWAYDPMGRIHIESERFIGLVAPYNTNVVTTLNGVSTISTDTSYSYYLNGDLFESNAPDWYEYATVENVAGEVTNVTDELDNVLTSATYTPARQLASAYAGGDGSSGAMQISNTYNSRLQPINVSATTSTGAAILNLTYSFNAGNGTSGSGSDNGNVIQIANGKNSNRTQNFLYDPLNRIWQAYTNGTNWGESYSPTTYAAGTAFSASTTAGIDAWGNLTNRSGVTGKTGYSEGALNCAPANLQNQLNTCYTYDAAGNMSQNGTTTYTYDAENRLIATAGISYVYDGDGNRIEKCTELVSNNVAKPGQCASNATGTFYWLHKDGGTLTESNLGGNFTEVYDLIHGQIAARIDLAANVVHYYFHDDLGSTSIVTDASGDIQNESDYYPYGGEMVITSSDSNRYKFTGKERDSESGLDNFGARYNASSMGRFMSPDPLGGRMLDPQTLNKYAYVRNNPTTLIDPTGMYTCADQADCKSKQDIAFEKSRQQDLKSKDSDVVRAAKAYGDPTKDNGVGVKFGDPGKGRDAITSHGIGQDPNSPNGLRAEETVTVRSGLSGSALDAAVGHEGSHVADAQDFVNAITTAGGMDQSKNLSTYATELKAYMVTQSVLSSENEKRGVGDCGVDPCILGAGVMPAQAKDTINRLLANPANQYGAAPNYGVTPASPGPVLYPSLTTPK